MDYNFGEAILSALFVMTVVFTVLISLWLMIRLFSAIIQVLEKSIATRNVDS